jgi:hypothetical protein
VNLSDGYLRVREGIDTVNFHGDVPSDHPIHSLIVAVRREFDFYVAWHDDVNFTKQEMDQAELMKCFPTSYVTHIPPETSGTVYETITICDRCKLTRRQQRSQLRLRKATLQGRKIAKTYGDDTYVLSPELAALFQEWGVSGCELAPVRDSRKGTDSPLVQLVPTWTLPDLAPSTPFTVDEDVLCRNCGQMGQYPLVLHYRREDLGEIHDVGLAPVFYSMNFFTTGYLIISRRLYRLMKENKVKGFRVEPVVIV